MTALFWVLLVLFAFLVLSLAFVLQGLRQIPASPPHIAVLTKWGKRTDGVVEEGWRFFPLFPLWHGVVLVPIVRINQEFHDLGLRTRDFAEVSAYIALTWSPDPKSAIMFLNNGGVDGVKNILNEVVQDRLREWLLSSVEGPMTWEDALGAGEEASAILLKAILGGELGSIPSVVPTRILLKFFNKPRKALLKSEVEEWGGEERKNWQLDDAWTNTIKLLPSQCSEEWRQLEEAVAQRHKDVQSARRGTGNFPFPGLGITLHRINVADIRVLGAVAEAAEKAAKEERELLAEKVEIGNIIARVNELRGAIEGLTSEQAIELIQTERQKVKKEILERKFSLSPGFQAAIESAFQSLAQGLRRS